MAQARDKLTSHLMFKKNNLNEPLSSLKNIYRVCSISLVHLPLKYLLNLFHWPSVFSLKINYHACVMIDVRTCREGRGFVVSSAKLFIAFVTNYF